MQILVKMDSADLAHMGVTQEQIRQGLIKALDGGIEIEDGTVYLARFSVDLEVTGEPDIDALRTEARALSAQVWRLSSDLDGPGQRNADWSSARGLHDRLGSGLFPPAQLKSDIASAKALLLKYKSTTPP